MVGHGTLCLRTLGTEGLMSPAEEASDTAAAHPRRKILLIPLPKLHGAQVAAVLQATCP
jgi:hypothetical protein